MSNYQLVQEVERYEMATGAVNALRSEQDLSKFMTDLFAFEHEEKIFARFSCLHLRH